MEQYNPLPAIEKIFREQEVQEGVHQDEVRDLQESIPPSARSIQHATPAHYPHWPTSLAGPLVKQPPSGQKSINALRPEQFAEVGYNQEAGTTPASDLPRTLPDESLRGRVSFDQDDPEQTYG